MGKEIENVGRRIHEVLNETLTRKLTVEEYKRVVRDIAWVFKRAQNKPIQ